MDLNECFEKGFIKITKINPHLIKSLIEMSEIKQKTVTKANLNNENISAYTPLAYDSLREILEALCISKGYKVTSHACIGELLKKDLGFIFFNQFNRFREIRNKINYYGKKIGYKQGKELINKIFLMKKHLLKEHLKEFD